jgi:hypothetical protein
MEELNSQKYTEIILFDGICSLLDFSALREECSAWEAAADSVLSSVAARHVIMCCNSTHANLKKYKKNIT